MEKTASINHINSKIKNQHELASILSYWKFKEKKVVFTNGCFDILHRGHIEYLSKAADLGNILIIGLNTDASVKRLKGNNRPVQDEYSRALILASLSFIDLIVYFEEDTPYKLINTVQPDVLVKGGDYSPENIVGFDIMKKNGGEVITIDFLDGYSTTNILKKGINQIK